MSNLLFSRQPLRDLFVPADGDIRKLAGKIAAVLRKSPRNEFPICMKATGIAAVNKTAKSLHVARQFLRETPATTGSSLSFRVNHGEGSDKERVSSLSFGVSSTDQFTVDGEDTKESMEEIWVKSLGSGRAIGGRIARALKVAQSAKVVAIGPRAVGRSIVGMTWARRTLHKAGMDMIAVPQMTDITMKDGDRTVSGFNFFVARTELQHLKWLDPEEGFDDDTGTSVVDKIEEDSIE